METSNLSVRYESANTSVQTSNEVNANTNQSAFESFCELSQKGYYICVDVKSEIKEKASFNITAVKENGKREEIRLFLNQEILDLVMNYLESGKLEDTSKVNSSDLKPFNEGAIEFKQELLQAEKAKGKKAVWSYAIPHKIISIGYKQGVIIFHPYPARRNNPINQFSKKIGETVYRLPASWILEDSFTHKLNRSNRLVFVG